MVLINDLLVLLVGGTCWVALLLFIYIMVELCCIMICLLVTGVVTFYYIFIVVECVWFCDCVIIWLGWWVCLCLII